MDDENKTLDAAQGDTTAAGGVGSSQADASGAETGGSGGEASENKGSLLGGPVSADDAAASGQTGEPEGDKQKTADKETKPDAAVPEKADAYTFQGPEGIPVDDTVLSRVKEIALAGKLTQEQFAAIMPRLVELDAGRVASMREAYERARAEGVASLKKKWGKDFAGNVALAQNAVRVFGTGALRDLFNTTGIGDHPLLLESYYNIGKALAEDQAFGRAVGSSHEPARDAAGNPQLTFAGMGKG